MPANNKNLIITIGAVLIAAFFMPWIKIFINLSAWDLVIGDASRIIDSSFRFITIVIPVTGLLVIYGAAFNNQNYPIVKPVLFLLPLLTLLVIAILIRTKLESDFGGITGSYIKQITQIFGIGFWLTLGASIVLPFLKSEPASELLNNNLNASLGNVIEAESEPAHLSNSQQFEVATDERTDYIQHQNIDLAKSQLVKEKTSKKRFNYKRALFLISILVVVTIAMIVLYQKFNRNKLNSEILSKVNTYNSSDYIQSNQPANLQSKQNDNSEKILRDDDQIDVSGKWVGFATSGVSQFPYEIILNQKDITVEGSIKISGSNDKYYAHYKVKGFVSNRTLALTGYEVIENINGEGYSWCMASLYLEYSTTGGDLYLKGTWGPNGFEGGCTAGNGNVEVQKK